MRPAVSVVFIVKDEADRLAPSLASVSWADEVLVADTGSTDGTAAIAEAKQLSGPVAPYFIDADATPNPGGWPRGGLTVVRFANSHLVYALTWFGMALLTVVGLWLFLREGRRNRS